MRRKRGENVLLRLKEEACRREKGKDRKKKDNFLLEGERPKTRKGGKG